MNGLPKGKPDRDGQAIHNQLIHLVRRELSLFFIHVKGVIPTGSDSNMYPLEVPCIGHRTSRRNAG